MRKSIFIIHFLIFIFVSCSHNVMLNPNIQPNAFSSTKSPSSVGVIFSDELKNHVETVNPSSYSGSAHTYNFEIGKPLSGALLRSVQIAYQDVLEVNTLESSEKFDKILKFTLQQSNMDIYFQEGFFTPNAKANCTLSIGIEAYDGKSNELLQMTTINGSGFSSKATDAFNANKSFAQAVETSIQQITDTVANLLNSGFAEQKISKEITYENNKSEGISDVTDVVYLKSGAIFKGKIIENKRDEYIKLKLFDEKVLKFDYQQIEKFETIIENNH